WRHLSAGGCHRLLGVRRRLLVSLARATRRRGPAVPAPPPRRWRAGRRVARAHTPLLFRSQTRRAARRFESPRRSGGLHPGGLAFGATTERRNGAGLHGGCDPDLAPRPSRGESGAGAYAPRAAAGRRTVGVASREA